MPDGTSLLEERQDLDYTDDPLPPRGPLTRLKATLVGKGILTMLTLAALGAAGILATNAAFTDQVTMAQITVTGGTLDLEANADAGDTNVAWSGSIVADVSGMAPGDTGTGTVELENVGDLPFTLTASVDGEDASGCFGLYLRETSVTGGSGAAAHPVNLTGLGTGAADGTVADFTSDPSGVDLPDNGVDMEWEDDDKKVYTLTILMKSTCVTNGASGTLDVSFDAAQV